MHSSDLPAPIRETFAPGAYAVINSEPPQVLLAENAAVISRLIAMKIVAAADPTLFPGALLHDVQGHLLDERWAEAVLMWMNAADTYIDVYEEYVPVWTEHDLDREVASMAIRMSRLFEHEALETSFRTAGR